MGNSILRLAEFVSDLSYKDLPEPVTEFVKDLLLDSMGCGVAGICSDKGKWGINFARRCYRGEPEATVLGYGDRMPAMGAAFVNAELINGLDYEAAGLHLPPFVIPPALAAAEHEGRSGKELITATALALEVGTRVAKGLISPGKPGGGIAPVFGPCSSVFGGAAGAASVKRFPRDRTAHAMGLAGVLSPVPSQASMHRDLPVNSGKYLMAGWAAQTGLTAAELAESGHRGNLQVLDSEYGYWRFTGQAGWDSRAALEDLGTVWLFLESTPYKKFPCCGMMHGGLECLKDLVEEHRLRPEEIEHVEAFLDPSSAEAMFHNRRLENQIDAQFSTAYNMALTVFGVRPGIRWQDLTAMRDPKIREFMDRITVSVHPECAEAQKKDPRARVVSVSVKARGQVYEKESRFIKGTVTAGAAMKVSREERLEKFTENTSPVLPEYRICEAVRVWSELEREPNLKRAMSLLHP